MWSLPLLQHFCHVVNHTSLFTSPSGSHLLPSSLYSPLTTSLFHLNSPPPLDFSLLIVGQSEHTVKITLAPFSHACMQHPQHPSVLPRMLTRSLTQLLHVFIKFLAFDEVPCSDKGVDHICTAGRKEERVRKRGEDRMEGESAVNALEQHSAPTGPFITAVRDVIILFWMEGGGRGRRQRALLTCTTFRNVKKKKKLACL